jgi:hypothetical protein
MKKIVLIVFALLTFASKNVLATNEALTVAVFDFESKDESVRDLGPQVATLLNANLSADADIITVERAELDKALGEQELGLSGTVSQQTAAKVGSLTGCKVLVTGRVFKMDKELTIVAKIIGTETGRVYGQLAKSSSASVSDLATDLATKIAKTVKDKRDTLIATSQTREERIDKVIKSLKSGKRPTVSVKIAERHFGQAVIDPAAETEAGVILQKAGFSIVDDKSEKKPEIEITGEAFSAFGARKGNLISCKARVELKIRNKKSDVIILVDRQTSVAVDLTEQTAAKTALQNAVSEAAERFVPALLK